MVVVVVVVIVLVCWDTSCVEAINHKHAHDKYDYLLGFRAASRGINTCTQTQSLVAAPLNTNSVRAGAPTPVFIINCKIATKQAGQGNSNFGKHSSMYKTHHACA